MEPIRPNGVDVRYIEVTSDDRPFPELRTVTRTVQLGSGDMSEQERDFMMIVSTFHVTYTVRDCGYGINLIVGNYGNQEPVYTEQVSYVENH